MTDKKPALPSKFIIYGALTLGLATAIAVRAIIVLDHLHPSWSSPRKPPSPTTIVMSSFTS
ncbi:MAG: hypothetical protein P8Z75_08960 [Gammaproteobacteria bacterium]